MTLNNLHRNKLFYPVILSLSRGWEYEVQCSICNDIKLLSTIKHTQHSVIYLKVIYLMKILNKKRQSNKYILEKDGHVNYCSNNPV